MNVLSIASSGYIARRLGGEGFAQFNIGMAFAFMFGPLTNMGLRALTVRHVAAHREGAAEYLGTVLVLRSVLAVVAVFVAMIAAPLSGGSEVTQQVITVSALTLFLNSVMGVLIDGLHAREEMGLAARASTWGGAAVTVVSVGVAAIGGGPVAIATAYLIGPAVTSVMLYHASGVIGVRPVLRWDLPEFRRLLAEALPYFGQGMVQAIASKLDLFILSRTLGEARLGGYTAANMLVSRAGVVVDGAGTALLPALARMRATADPEASRTIRNVLAWLLFLTIPLAIGVALAAPSIVAIVFGSGFADGAPILAIRIFALPLTAIAMVSGHALFSAHRNRLVVGSSIGSTLATTAAIIPTTLAFGVWGAPVARLAGQGLLIALRLPVMVREYAGTWTATESRRLAAVTLAGTLPLALVRLLGGGIPVTILAGVVGALAYGIVVVRAGLLPPAILDRVAGIGARWRRP